MKVFEVLGAGFVGDGTTEDRVIWVRALNEQQVLAVILDSGATFYGEIDIDCDDDAIDFTLPAQILNLQERLLQFASDERNKNRG